MTRTIFAILCLCSTALAQVTSSPTTKPAEQFMSDEEFLRIGQEFDLDAYLKKLKAIPPREPDHANAQTMVSARDIPALPKDVEVRIDEWTERINVLKRQSATGGDAALQKEALDEAILLAERIVKLRVGAGQPAVWYEVVDSKQQVATLRQVRGLSMIDRRLWAAAEARGPALEDLAVQGRFEAATLISQSQLAVFGRLFPIGHPDVAKSLNNVATFLRVLGQAKDAESLSLQAVEILRRLLPGDHPEFAASVQNLAAARQALGWTEEAEPLFRQVLEMNQGLFAGDNVHVAVAMNDLAFARLNLGRASEAEPLFQKALRMYEHLLPSDHPYIVSCLNNLALARQALGRAENAEPLYQRALEILQRRYKDDHRYIATTLNNLASVRNALGRASEAELLYQQALEMRQRLFPQGHPDLARSLNNLALVREELGRPEEAEPLLQRTLEIYQGVHDADHEDVARSLNNLAFVRQSLGRSSEAEPLYQQALEMRRRLFSGDHPYVATSLNNLAGVRQSLGRAAEAEPLYVQALEMRRRLLRVNHPDVAHSMNNVASVRADLGRFAEAEPLFRGALDMIERLRTETTGGAQQRAAFAEKLQLSETAVAYARTLVMVNKRAEVLAIMERGRARAALDLLESSGRDLAAEVMASGDPQRKHELKQARDREDTTRRGQFEEEALLAGLNKQRDALAKRSDLSDDECKQRLSHLDQQIAAQTEKVKDAQQELTEAGSAMLIALRGLFPAGKALTLEQILSGLESDEAVISFAFGEDTVLTAVAVGSVSSALIIADGKEATEELVEKLTQLRNVVAKRPEGGESLDKEILASLRSTLLPNSLMGLLAGARRWVVLPDGPLNGIPLELLWPNVDSAPQILYAPSATVYLNRREAKKKRFKRAKEDKIAAVIVGDPDFGVGRRHEPDYPETGVLLTYVVEGRNAAVAGLRRGDVLLRYSGETLLSADELGPAIQKALIATTQPTGASASSQPIDSTMSVAYWRDGRTYRTHVQPGKLGVLPSRALPGEGLRSMKLIDQVTRGGDAFSAGASAVEQVRLFGGELAPLPGSGREARAIADVLRRKGGRPTLLVGANANAPKLWEAVASKRPRYVHLATHGLMGSTDRPLDAALALAQPKQPTVDDIGFLRLEDLMSRWGGRLNNCDLVVLSACDTQRGVQKGDSVMSLPLGFFFAGAPTVVASMWKVDDAATQLLMTRFYENLLGQYDQSRRIADREFTAGTPMPKATALREAKRWLRTLTAEQLNERLTGDTSGDTRGTVRERSSPSASASAHPYAHPYYWAAFILMGDPG